MSLLDSVLSSVMGNWRAAGAGGLVNSVDLFGVLGALLQKR